MNHSASDLPMKRSSDMYVKQHRLVGFVEAHLTFGYVRIDIIPPLCF